MDLYKSISLERKGERSPKVNIYTGSKAILSGDKPAPGSALEPGQLVFGAAGTNFMYEGAMSEYGLASTKAITPIPAGLSTTDAASITMAGLTAYQSILPHSKPGSRVFLNGGSGGVGTFGIQIAKAEGRHVTMTCSTANVELCNSLGTDEVIDYKMQNVLQTLKASPHKYDLVVDLVGNGQNLYWKHMNTQTLERNL